MKKLNSSRLRLLTWAVLFAAGGFASCSDNGGDEPAPAPPVELKNQIEYDGGKLIDIKSDIAGMSAAKDYLAVVVRNPKGQVNTATETFEITYKDISVKKQTMDDVAKVQLSADLVAETQQLNLYIEVALKSGKTLLVRYESACTEAVPQELENQFDLDKSITDIGSVADLLRRGCRNCECRPFDSRSRKGQSSLRRVRERRGRDRCA